MLHVTTENVIVKGEKFVRVKKIRAMKHKQLPDMYVSDPHGRAVYLTDDNKELITPKNFCVMKVGELYELEFFSSKLAFIEECGERLMRIKLYLAKENENYAGVLVTHHI